MKEEHESGREELDFSEKRVWDTGWGKMHWMAGGIKWRKGQKYGVSMIPPIGKTEYGGGKKE